MIENTKTRPAQRGFSLIEISIVLIIVGLLLGGLMAPLGTQIESSRRNETKQQIAQSIEAVYGYSLANGRLPCPDTTNDGAENRTGNNCTAVSGNLPWATLAMNVQDSWGQPLLYRVSNNFADLVDGTGCAATPAANISFSLCSVGDIQVRDSAGGTFVAINVPALVISRGKNWAVAPAADEAENSNNDVNFVKKNYSSAAGAEFDDMVSWVVPGILISRMVKAGRLP